MGFIKKFLKKNGMKVVATEIRELIDAENITSISFEDLEKESDGKVINIDGININVEKGKS